MQNCKICKQEFDIPKDTIILALAWICQPCWKKRLKEMAQTKKSPQEIISDQFKLL